MKNVQVDLVFSTFFAALILTVAKIDAIFLSKVKTNFNFFKTGVGFIFRVLFPT